ncbi:MAG TPA: phytanoyl-CoA dioxygenase family protein [Bryobacteraceae bacterium]|nr:phytanoyl-CoA dioxygenase family protein [Bryobacteraceae bacterium]
MARTVFYDRRVAQKSVCSFERDSLEQQGYVVLKNFIQPELLIELRSAVDQLFQLEGEAAGSEFRQEPGSRRLANLVAKGGVFERLVAMPAVLEYIQCVIGPNFKLSSLNARSANTQSDSLQPLHADVGAVADEKGYWVCNTVWMLDEFTEENGALRVVPGSHKWRRLPKEELCDPYASHPEERLVTAEAGTLVVMNAHMWHGGTANKTVRPRTALHGFYCRSDKPQQQYQRALIPAQIQERFSPELRRILALDDPENDRLSSSSDKPSGFLK